MKAGSMEGLIGASNNIKLADVPMRVYREAERRGDTSTMERAMGYASDFTQKAYEYKEKAQDELIKELKEERSEQQVKQDEAVEKSKQEVKADIEQISVEAGLDHMDDVIISEEGIKCLEQQSENGKSTYILTDSTVKIYTSEGKAAEQTQSVNVDIVTGK